MPSAGASSSMPSQVRGNMVASQPSGQTASYETWFYIGGVIAPIAFSGSLLVRSYASMGLAAIAAVSLLIVAGLAPTAALMRTMSLNPSLPSRPTR